MREFNLSNPIQSNPIQSNICVMSSFIFLTNYFVAYLLFNLKFYAILFLLLWITSILYHTNKNMYTNIVDKIVIFAIFIYGLYLFYTKSKSNKTIIKIFIILSFLLTILIYIHGQMYQTKYEYILHSILHIIGSIGHHLIVFL